MPFPLPFLFETLTCSSVQFSSFQSLSFVWFFYSPMACSMPGFPVCHQLMEPPETHVHWVGDAIQPSHPLSYPSPPAFNISQHQGLFQWVSSSHQVVRVLEFQLHHQSLRMVWLDLHAVQGTLKSLLQHHSSKASILWGSAFFIVQLSHPYMTGSHTKTWASLVAQMVKNLLAMQET